MNQNIITLYVPIFREKLDRLEKKGRGTSDEAVRLRATLAEVAQVAHTDSAPQTPGFEQQAA